MSPHFHCQRCQQPIELNEREFLAADTTEYTELMEPLLSAHQQSVAASQSAADDKNAGTRPGSASSGGGGSGKAPAAMTATSSRRSSNFRAPAPVSRRTVHAARKTAQPGQDPHLFLTAEDNHAPLSAATMMDASMLMDRSFVVLPQSSGDRPRSAGDRVFQQGLSKSQSSLDQPIDDANRNLNTADVSSQASRPNEDEGLLSRKMRVAGRFFDLLSAYSDLDHPLCEECANTVTDMLNQQMDEALKEKSILEEVLNNEDWTSITADGTAALEAEIAELQKEEARLLFSIGKAETQYEEVQQEWAAIDKENRELDALEQAYWQEHNVFALAHMTLQDQQEAMQRQLDHYSAQLEKLRKTNVYNDAFHIWHDGPFGTINGLRLGRTAEHQVEWSEINAAWGQALLLLYVMAEKLHFQFQTYKLVPLGSFSRIEKVDGDRASYEMYGSGDIQLSRLLWNRRFDSALTAFLHCIQQLSDFALTKDPSFKLPYAINKDKIGDISIRTQFNQDEQWTKACKFTLTNLKWLLAFTCKQ